MLQPVGQRVARPYGRGGGEGGTGGRGGDKTAQQLQDRSAERSQARGVNPDVWVHGTPRGRASITCSAEPFTRRSDGEISVCV
ncbi:hypothetical protein SSTG_02697 [Streptomyces sp. e14]|nr:hypothetical protein SSTG_02697 [Streptomyces sp. e14]